MLSKAVTVPYTMSIWTTEPNFVGNGRGVLLDKFLGMVATSPISRIFSRSEVEIKKIVGGCLLDFF